MNKYQVGSPILLSLNTGKTVLPDTVRLLAQDETGATIYDVTAPPDTTLTINQVSVPASVNNTAGLRTIQVFLTYPDTSITAKLQYLLYTAPSDALVLFKNSFQTYSQVLVRASQMIGLSGWDGLSDVDRVNALAESFRQLTTFAYRVRSPFYLNQDYLDLGEYNTKIIPRHWQYMTMTRWNSLPAAFRDALCRAQIAHAIDVMTSDPVSDKRRSGLLSESIGESSMMFRSGKPIDIGLSSTVTNYLKSYFDFTVTLTRS